MGEGLHGDPRGPVAQKFWDYPPYPRFTGGLWGPCGGKSHSLTLDCVRYPQELSPASKWYAILLTGPSYERLLHPIN